MNNSTIELDMPLTDETSQSHRGLEGKGNFRGAFAAEPSLRVLFSALISPHGTPARIYEAWHEGVFSLVSCQEQIEEIRVASRYPRLRAILQPHRVGRMLNSIQRARIVEGIPRKHTADDPHDSYLLDLADFASAQYLVTGDKRAGLLNRGSFGGCQILTAAAFCHMVVD